MELQHCFHSFVSFQPAYLSSPPLSSSILQPGRVRIGLKQLQQLRSKLGSLVRTSSFPLPLAQWPCFLPVSWYSRNEACKICNLTPLGSGGRDPCGGDGIFGPSESDRRSLDSRSWQTGPSGSPVFLSRCWPGKVPPPPDLLPVPGA